MLYQETEILSLLLGFPPTVQKIALKGRQNKEDLDQ